MTKTRKLVTISLYVALSVVLDIVKEFLPFLNMPMGGSINIALIPIVLCSFKLGYKEGIVVGVLWFIVSSILGLNKYFVSFPQIICDYIIPSVVLGFSSIFYKNKKIISMEIGITLMMIIRTLSLVISGAYFWYDGAAGGSLAAWTYSCVYNLPYSIASLCMLLIVVPIINKYLV